jgi:ABC-type phosphate transport system permease subunit
MSGTSTLTEYLAELVVFLLPATNIYASIQIVLESRLLLFIRGISMTLTLLWRFFTFQPAERGLNGGNKPDITRTTAQAQLRQDDTG